MKTEPTAYDKMLLADKQVKQDLKSIAKTKKLLAQQEERLSINKELLALHSVDVQREAASLAPKARY